MSRRVAIIGGGISGLTTAYLVKRSGLETTVFEATNRLGGNIQTVSRDGYTFEAGPNSLLRSPRLVDLIRLLKLDDRVIASDEAAKKRYVLFDGKLEPIGLRSFINGYFSLATIAALIREPFNRSRSPEGESVADFISRRFGREVVEKALDPFVSGIYAGDPHNLSIRAAFPKLFEMERDYGSLIMAALRRKVKKSHADFPRTFSFQGGLKTLISSLSNELCDQIKLSSRIEKIEKAGDLYLVNGETFSSVVISTTAFVAANLIRGLDDRLAGLLSEVSYPQIAVVVFGFRSESFKVKPDGFGFLIASSERRPILGTVFHSVVFPERAPNGHELLVTFVGGVRSGESLDTKTDDDLEKMVRTELGEILGVSGEPDLVHIKRWRKAIPQYSLGYEKLIDACTEFEKNHRGLYFCSNFYRGISVGDCVANAFETANKIERNLKK